MDDSVDKNRWVSEEWRSFELYEKKRIRTRRSKLTLISLAVLLFLGLCSVPVIQERSPKWKTLKIARNLSVEIEKLKTMAIKAKKPMRLSFADPNLLQVDQVDHCSTPTRGEEVGIQRVTKQWSQPGEGDFKVLSPTEAAEYSIALVASSICFDPVDGLVSKFNKQVIVIAPVKDLTEKRLDRASYVIIEGESAKVSLN